MSPGFVTVVIVALWGVMLWLRLHVGYVERVPRPWCARGGMAVRESKVEKHLRVSVEGRGGLCEKHVSPGRRGVPDRLVTWPGGIMDLVETKRPKGTVRKNQEEDHKRRARLGIKVYVLDTIEAVDWYIQQLEYRRLMA